MTFGYRVRRSDEELFQARLNKWLEDSPTWAADRVETIKAIRHQKLKFSPLKAIPVVGRPAIMSSAPLIAAFGYQVVEVTVGVFVAGGLFAGHLVMSGLERWNHKKDGTINKAEGDIAYRVGDLLASIRSDATLVRDRGSSITATLGIIEGYARLVTGARKGQISVSLSLYDGTGYSKMKMLHRHSGSERPVNRKFGTKHVLGHHAVQAGGGPRVVNDLKLFGKCASISPTGSAASYRSILFFPIKSHKDSGKQGFISVDCTEKYAFFGSRSEKLTFICSPLVEHIQDLI